MCARDNCKGHAYSASWRRVRTVMARGKSDARRNVSRRADTTRTDAFGSDDENDGDDDLRGQDEEYVPGEEESVDDDSDGWGSTDEDEDDDVMDAEYARVHDEIERQTGGGGQGRGRGRGAGGARGPAGRGGGRAGTATGTEKQHVFSFTGWKDGDVRPDELVVLRNFLVTVGACYCVSIERGILAGNLHFQGVIKVRTTSAQAFNARLRRALGWSGGSKVMLKTLNGMGLHTWVGMVGYCMKVRYVAIPAHCITSFLQSLFRMCTVRFFSDSTCVVCCRTTEGLISKTLKATTLRMR